ncbi:MAG: tyrosine--tRNA ligase, partial [Alphaproteobacteria bacterium]|nr:tyrosine--tRNA ligase [Alphaproteobacteria bacterium]
ENTEMLLALFTDIPMDEIRSMCVSDIISAKKRMAFEVTKLIHGEELAKQAIDAANALFGGGVNSANVPSFDLKMDAPMNIIDFLIAVKLFDSKSEARRMVEQGGIQIDGNKITDKNYTVEPAESIMVQRGKKVFLKVNVK